MSKKIALVDDHTLFRKGLINILEGYGFDIVFDAANGKEYMDKMLLATSLPDIVLMDIIMPERDGLDCTIWSTKNYPQVKILTLTMSEDEMDIIKMMRCGAKGYIVKHCETEELITAITSVLEKGFYLNEFISHHLIKFSVDESVTEIVETSIKLTEKEKIFLKYCCSDLSYAQIAEKMFLSPRTIEGYRDTLCQKLQVKSRVSLVIYAIKAGIYKP